MGLAEKVDLSNRGHGRFVRTAWQEKVHKTRGVIAALMGLLRKVSQGLGVVSEAATVVIWVFRRLFGEEQNTG